MAPMVGMSREALIEALSTWIRAPKLPITLAVYEPRAVVRREGERWVIRALVQDEAALAKAEAEAREAGGMWVPEMTWRTLVPGPILLEAADRRRFIAGIRAMDGRGLFPEDSGG